MKTSKMYQSVMDPKLAIIENARVNLIEEIRPFAEATEALLPELGKATADAQALQAWLAQQPFHIIGKPDFAVWEKENPLTLVPQGFCARAEETTARSFCKILWESLTTVTIRQLTTPAGRRQREFHRASWKRFMLPTRLPARKI